MTLSIRLELGCLTVLMQLASTGSMWPSLLLLATLTSSPPGAAAAASAAEALTRRSIIEYNGGEFDQALADAKKAYASRPAPGLLFNLGQIHRALHHWEEAAFSYQAYLRELPGAPNRTAVESLLRELRKKLAEQTEPEKPSSPPLPSSPPMAAVAPAEPAHVEPAKPRVARIAVLDVQPQGNIPEGVAKGVTSLVVHDVRKQAVGTAVVGADEIRAMVGLEHQKQLLGCTDLSCLAEIGGALGAERLVLGSLSRFGDSYVVDLKLVEARTARVLAEGSARVEREGALPEAVTRSLEELLPNLRPSPGDTSERPELVAGAEPEKPRTHALAWTLFAASGVAAGFAIYGAARVAQVEGAINAVNGPGVSASVYQANLGTALGGANAQNWQWAAIALGAVSVAAAVSGVLTW